MQRVQTEEARAPPPVEKVPAVHELHVVAAVLLVLENVPAGQRAQVLATAAPGMVEYVPGEHPTHFNTSFSPCPDENVPAEQARQDPAAVAPMVVE
jgi:hypothetical protein